MPEPPDAGFFGRDETLLALDRAFDAQRVVLLHAFAGAGKSSTVAEFARWYRTTGGLDDPATGRGVVLWSSFEHHLPVDRLLDAAGDCFSGSLEANGIPWQATTDPDVRRDLIMQILAQVPVLWVWDNVEPVTGFPPGTPSVWTQGEQDDLVGFLRELAQHTRCKVLVTSRRDEQAWLAGLPARLALPPMPMRERLQLTTALAARYGEPDPGIDWRPLLRYTLGSPLTITVLAGQALREGLRTTAQVEAFVDRLRAGEAELEPGEDAALGRTRSLAASLSYGFAHAFTEAERGQLAVLHLFRDTIDAEALRFMGDPDITESDAVPQLAGLTSDAAIALLDRAAAIGLLSGLGGGYYTIHPALPWYFTTLFAAAYGPPASPAARQAVRAYTHTFAVTLEHLGYILSNQDDPGCLPYYEEALSLYQRISARAEEARLALTLGNTYKDVPGLRDLGQAEHWYQHSLTHRADNDTLGRAKTLASLGILAYGRFDEARDAREPEPVLLAHLNTALDRLQQALALLPPDDAEDLAAVHGQLGNIYRMAGDTRQALRHYQQSIAHEEARGNTYGAGRTRFNIALLLEGDGRRADALLYARAALSDFERVGSGATQQATKTQDLITRLEGNSP